MNQIDPAISAPHMYARLPGDADRVYRALCAALVWREVDWAAFSEADWRLLVYMADPRREGVGPALHWRFKDGGWPEGMPDGVRQRLRETYYSTLAHNTLLLQELGRVLEALAGAGIPVIVLKGAALAVAVYEDIGLRPMGDLDLLVRPEDVRRARAALEAAGYLVLSANTEIGMQIFGGPEIRIDLHWCLVSGYSEQDHDIDWFAEGAEEVPLAGTTVMQTFLPETHLAYLASHAISLPILRAFYDIHLLDAGRCPDWERIRAVLGRTGWSGPGGAMLARTDDLFGLREGYDIRGDPVPGLPLSRTRLLRLAWARLDSQTRLEVLGLVVLPTRSYLEWRYGRRIRLSLPFWIALRWLDIGFDVVKSSLPRRIKMAPAGQGG